MSETETRPSPLLEQELVKLEHEWARAWQMPDLAALDRILADDFILTSSRSKGELMNKRQYIETAVKLLRGGGFRLEKIAVRLYGDTAVVNASFHQQATFAGQDWSGAFLLTDVWVRRGETDDAWQAVARHESRPLAP